MSDTEYPESFPDPIAHASAFASHYRGDGEGVYRDAIVDAAVEATGYAHTARDVAVRIDGVCDAGEPLPDEAVEDLRKMQLRLQRHAAWASEFADALFLLLEQEAWEWTVEGITGDYYYPDKERLAAYRCADCGTVTPHTFTRGFTQGESGPPETLGAGICGERWGGCGESTHAQLVGDGFID